MLLGLICAPAKTRFRHPFPGKSLRFRIIVDSGMLWWGRLLSESRVDLPVKKLEDLSRARMKCARHLRKMDIKKEEYMNLWKLCNIYSATAVDVDDAMREIRNALRKRLKPKDSSRDVSAFRRLIDEYRPSKKTTTVEHQQETYDKPTSKV
ncbi:unnamed protein product [Nippostrongylus brasiliensis]|uniref:Uncharacterized protein n=1 Tax=Nippostrongylus brasiliensis TaxID=27835 RepID=A0A0N4XMY9_NIPBR|nr:unnamed protein product [Nippostrongylus brasiliensis]